MKILFIGHYREDGGWANASFGLIGAMQSVGLDVVCRNIALTKYNTDIPSNVIEAESGNLDDVDVCIQQVLPHFLVGSKKFKKNIAYFFTESENLGHLQWIRNLKLVDEVWTSAEDCKKELLNNGLKTQKIPQAFNLSNYEENIESKEIGNKNAFKFYTIASLTDRKNLRTLIKIYLTAFESRDNVELLLKVNASNPSDASKINLLQKEIEEIKASLRLHKNPQRYPNILIETNRMSTNEMYSLHKSCDCFINVSHGEAWSIPAFEAMCFGNTPICTAWGGPSEYIDKNNKNTGWLIDYSMSISEYADGPFPFLGTARELWASPNEKQVIDAMRYYYHNRNKINKLDGINQAKNFSFENVGNIIKEKLNNE